MPGGVNYTYEYDNLHRLLEEIPSVTGLPTDADIMAYNYDDSEHINAVTTIIYNGADYGFTYDANGNMKDGWDLTDPNDIAERHIIWNADNMPVTVTCGSTTTNLTYDGDGVRAKKIEVGATTSTTYYISNDYEIKNGTPIKYIFAGNLRVAEIEGSTSTIFHKDHLGSSTAMTNSGGTKIESTEYLPFGSQRSHSGANTTDYLYTDQEHDNESGLYNYNARLYDPVIGRFISSDRTVPQAFNPQSLNRYSYSINNPLIYIDPSGEENIVVSGGGWYKEYPYNFIEAAIFQLIKYTKASDENTTWIVADVYSKEIMKNIGDVAKNLGVKLVTIGSSKELTNYINSKNTSNSSLGKERLADRVTDMAVFSHGLVGSVELAYGINSQDAFSWSANNARGLLSGAFEGNATLNFYSCNPATSFNEKGDSLLSEVYKSTNATVSGYRGQSTYSQMNYPQTMDDKLNRFNNGFNTNGSKRLPQGGKGASLVVYPRKPKK